MTTIVGIRGSLRHGSFYGMILRAAAEMAPAGTAIEIAGGLAAGRKILGMGRGSSAPC